MRGGESHKSEITKHTRSRFDRLKRVAVADRSRYLRTTSRRLAYSSKRARFRPLKTRKRTSHARKCGNEKWEYESRHRRSLRRPSAHGLELLRIQFRSPLCSRWPTGATPFSRAEVARAFPASRAYFAPGTDARAIFLHPRRLSRRPKPRPAKLIAKARRALSVWRATLSYARLVAIITCKR